MIYSIELFLPYKEGLELVEYGSGLGSQEEEKVDEEAERPLEDDQASFMDVEEGQDFLVETEGIDLRVFGALCFIARRISSKTRRCCFGYALRSTRRRTV